MQTETFECPYAAKCGACEWLEVPYEEQLQRKQAYLEELFEPFGCAVEPIKGMREPVGYRAKVMTPFQPGPKGTLLHGMYEKGTHNIVEMQNCLVEDSAAQPIMRTIARLAREFRIKPYQEDTGHGLLRHAVVRVAKATGECMVTLVVNSKEFPRKKEFVRALRDEHPEIATVAFNINTHQTNAVLGTRTSVAYGQGWLEDRLCGCTFRIPADAFYQTNPTQTEVLYNTAIRFAKLQGGETVLDAYCGIGTIGICAAHAVRNMPSPKPKKKAKKKKTAAPAVRKPVRIIGVESVASAVETAAENARINRINHTEFHAGDAGTFLTNCTDELDVVFMDPPRAGASEEFLAALMLAAPKRVVYVSCNPESQARDLQVLKELYTVERAVGVDMFPHTSHVETCCLLVRENAHDDEMASIKVDLEGISLD